MKYATLAQGQKVLDLIVKKGVPVEQMQQLLESGFLEDLLDAHLDEVDRRELRSALGITNTYTVNVDYSVSTIIAVEKFTKRPWLEQSHMLRRIDDLNDTGNGSSTLVMISYRPKRYEYAKDVLEWMRTRNTRPATLRETISFAHHERTTLPLVALGTKVNGGNQYYPVVRRDQRPEDIDTEGPRFPPTYRFAAVVLK